MDFRTQHVVKETARTWAIVMQFGRNTRWTISINFTTKPLFAILTSGSNHMNFVEHFRTLDDSEQGQVGQ